MRKSVSVALLLAAAALPVLGHEWEPPGAPCAVSFDREEAFPEAEGFGATTAGGRCGAVVEVSDLSDSIPPTQGSLRWAIEEVSGPRTIVFSEAGIITLQQPIILIDDAESDDSHLTIAGESAPGGGIVVAEYGLHLRGVHDVIVRHLRFRNVRAFEPAQGVPTNGDGLELEAVERVVIDHVSVAWATDEGIGIERSNGEFMGVESHEITVQNSFVAETLWNGEHLFGVNPHSRGMIASDGTYNVSFHHTFLISNNQRNPSLQGPFTAQDCPAEPQPQQFMDARWGLVYNWGHDDVDPPNVNLKLGEGPQFGQGVLANVANLWLREGPDTAVTSGLNPMEAVDPCPLGTQIYLTATAGCCGTPKASRRWSALCRQTRTRNSSEAPESRWTATPAIPESTPA